MVSNLVLNNLVLCNLVLVFNLVEDNLVLVFNPCEAWIGEFMGFGFVLIMVGLFGLVLMPSDDACS